MMLISGSVDLGERRVQRRRLARARRACHEQRARRPPDDLGQLVAHRLRQAERLERRRLARLVDQAHHDLLALDRRQHRHADVEHPPHRPRVERDAPVLRLAALRDVELREHLQAGRDAVRHPLRDALRLVEHAVDADAHEQRVLLRLEVDVAGAVGGRLHHDRVDESHERRVGDAVVDLEVVVVVDDLDVVERRLGLHRLALAGEALELRQDLLTVCDADLDGVPGREPQLVDAVDVLRVGDGDAQLVVGAGHRHGDHALQRLQRDQLGGARATPAPRRGR